jgi:hypothetical protein
MNRKLAFSGVPTMYRHADEGTAQKMARIHEEIAMMRGGQKKIMPFGYCWNLLKQQRPELFDGLDEKQPGVQQPASKMLTGPFTPHALFAVNEYYQFAKAKITSINK